MKNLFSIFIFFLFIAVGCKKEHPTSEIPPSPSKYPPCQVQPTILISKPAMVLCKYKVGTFWVFRDSISGSIDTLNVESVIQAKGFTPPRFQGCDSSEIYIMTLKMKNEPELALSTMNFNIYPEVIFAYNKFLYRKGADFNSVIFKDAYYDSGVIIRDSSFISGQYYKPVAESIPIEFIQSGDPDRMVPTSLKIFFNPQFGLLQLDYRNRLSLQLTKRMQVLSRHIVR